MLNDLIFAMPLPWGFVVRLNFWINYFVGFAGTGWRPRWYVRQCFNDIFV